MISSWDLYFITRLDYIQGFFIAVATVVGIATLVYGVATHIDHSVYHDADDIKARIKLLKKLGLTTVLSAFLACLIPTTKEYAAITIIPAIANNEDVQDMGQELIMLGKEWLIELRPTQETK